MATSFRVTQDVDGDGTEEQIYGEGVFDVRWNLSGPLYVNLIADANALCVPICEPVDPIPCEDKPVINTAGYMPLEATHHDNTSGYGRRVNRPTTTGDYPPPPATGAGPESAVSPYAGSLNLHGCHRIDAATHYRFTYVLNGVGSPVPLKGMSWWAPRSASSPGAPVHVLPDAEGWYPILNAGDVEHPSWLLHWNTRAFANGKYELVLETGLLSGGTVGVISSSDPATFTVDNSRPLPSFLDVWWRYADVGGLWMRLADACPAIHRDPTRPIRVRVRWSATADHLRNAEISFSGCGLGQPHRVQPTPVAPDIEEYRQWYSAVPFGTVLQSNEFEIPPYDPVHDRYAPGCYTLHLYAVGRAFNPSGFDHGPSNNWLTNQTWSWKWAHRSISVVHV